MLDGLSLYESGFEKKPNDCQRSQGKDNSILYVRPATLHPYIKMRGMHQSDGQETPDATDESTGDSTQGL